jgi:hypothetical protein
MRRRISHVEQRRYTWRDVWRDLVPLLLLALLAYSYFADTPTTADLRRVEVKDRDTQRATAYRLCTRNKVDRAFAHGRLRGINVKGEPPRIPGPIQLERKARIKLSRLLMAPEYLPILDCAPNLQGLGAKPMSIGAQEKFMQRWSRKQTAPAERGVCPRSVIGGAVRADRC